MLNESCEEGGTCVEAQPHQQGRQPVQRQVKDDKRGEEAHPQHQCRRSAAFAEQGCADWDPETLHLFARAAWMWS